MDLGDVKDESHNFYLVGPKTRPCSISVFPERREGSRVTNPAGARRGRGIRGGLRNFLVTKLQNGEEKNHRTKEGQRDRQC